MALVDDGVLRLQDPVAEWLPELANRRVLTSPDAPLSSTVAARREVTVRDLLTFTWGFGLVVAAPGALPVQRAVDELGLGGTGRPHGFSPEEWLARLGSLPLVRQPGEMWMYHTGADVLGFLVARASGRRFGEFLRERVFEPLGMVDSGFFVPPERVHRLPVSFAHDQGSGELVVWDPSVGGKYAVAPASELGGDGLVATAADYAAFQRMLLSGGGGVLSARSVALMTSDQLTAAQKVEKDRYPHLFGDHGGFGFCTGVRAGGQFGWDGGLGTSTQCDPALGLNALLFTQVAQDSEDTPSFIREFWATVYAEEQR
ncbi:CubicO group peptidase (beta-lactamase class C family) [Crossiella equi]|uniref:CubicO group peptidase (Beta-lactamase class C family) n=2 Tax=Crossiella equi TaxID=130796 RepID=A0ABS5A8Z1_9PSEU|nr:CubicO group peptidase (beta-lactamase class C family) [Crossiella equi]